MKQRIISKGLAVAVIILFLGVGIQPALADEISTNIVSDVDEDCLDCQPVNRVELLKVKLLLIRIEAFTNIILSRFGHIPEVKEKCEEILDIINSEGLNDIICNILMRIGIFLEELGKKFPEGTIINPILAIIMFPVIILWNMYCE